MADKNDKPNIYRFCQQGVASVSAYCRPFVRWSLKKH